MSKKTTGIILTIFFGIFALLGLLSCDTKEEKDEFMSGFWIGLIISVIPLILFILLFFIFAVPFHSNLFI